MGGVAAIVDGGLRLLGMFEYKIPDDFEIPPGHFFRSQKEDMSGKKRTSGHPSLPSLVEIRTQL